MNVTVYLYEDYSGTWQYKNKHLSADKIKITGRILFGQADRLELVR